MIYAFLSNGIAETVLLMLILSAAVLPLVALVDILTSRFEPMNKLIWIIVVIFTNLLGALLYFSIGRKQKIG